MGGDNLDYLIVIYDKYIIIVVGLLEHLYQ